MPCRKRKHGSQELPHDKRFAGNESQGKGDAKAEGHDEDADVNETNIPADTISELTASSTGTKGITQSDTGISQSDQGITQSDQGITQSDTGISQSDQGITQSDQGITQSDQGITQSDQGITLSDQGITQSDQGIALSDQGITQSYAGFLDAKKSCQWRDIRAENLCLDLTQLYNRAEASTLLTLCEQQLVYNTGLLATVKLFGKRINIPRKQVAHGDPGLTYTFSGNTVPARPWTPLLVRVRDQISQATGLEFNFVLINRYNDGHDYMGEHKDDERDLFPGHPIASLTLGQPRDFVFKHQDCRGKHSKRKIDPVVVRLEHGMLLLMKHPTNSFWYHSLPRRTRALDIRVNMTFRKMQPSNCRPA